jgi:hypothetical protein
MPPASQQLVMPPASQQLVMPPDSQPNHAMGLMQQLATRSPAMVMPNPPMSYPASHAMGLHQQLAVVQRPVMNQQLVVMGRQAAMAQQLLMNPPASQDASTSHPSAHATEFMPRAAPPMHPPTSQQLAMCAPVLPPAPQQLVANPASQAVVLGAPAVDPPEPPRKRGPGEGIAKAARWTQEEEYLLHTVVASMGEPPRVGAPRPGFWSTVAAKLGTGRSTAAVDQHWTLLTGVKSTPLGYMRKAPSATSRAPAARQFIAPAAGVAKGRRRWFPESSIRASTAAPNLAAPPLSHAAVSLCDRLATVVVQQLTTRSFQHSRRAKTSRRLTSDDVIELVQADGSFDFLQQASVIRVSAQSHE